MSVSERTLRKRETDGKHIYLKADLTYITQYLIIGNKIVSVKGEIVEYRIKKNKLVDED